MNKRKFFTKWMFNILWAIAIPGGIALVLFLAWLLTHFVLARWPVTSFLVMLIGGVIALTGVMAYTESKNEIPSERKRAS